MKNGALRIAGIVLGVLIVASVSACAPAENVSAAQTQQTLRQLQAAREIDLSDASDPAVGPVASGDYSIRAENAAQAISDLEHGQYVSQSQIDDAQFVPPKSLSLEQRARLVGELKAARAMDNRGWWDWTRDPIVAQDFSVQEIKANRAIRDLETSRQVSWLEIEEGLEVPEYP